MSSLPRACRPHGRRRGRSILQVKETLPIGHGIAILRHRLCGKKSLPQKAPSVFFSMEMDEGDATPAAPDLYTLLDQNAQQAEALAEAQTRLVNEQEASKELRQHVKMLNRQVEELRSWRSNQDAFECDVAGPRHPARTALGACCCNAIRRTVNLACPMHHPYGVKRTLGARCVWSECLHATRSHGSARAFSDRRRLLVRKWRSCGPDCTGGRRVTSTRACQPACRGGGPALCHWRTSKISWQMRWRRRSRG